MPFDRVTARLVPVAQETADALLDQAREVAVWLKGEYRHDGYDVPERQSVAGSRRATFAMGDLVVACALSSDDRRCDAIFEVTDVCREDPDFLVSTGMSREAAEHWRWATPVKTRLSVPTDRGIPLVQLGKSGQSLQGGHARMPPGGLLLALEHMVNEVA